MSAVDEVTRFRAYCEPCGAWVGKARRKYTRALDDAQDHDEAEHPWRSPKDEIRRQP